MKTSTINSKFPVTGLSADSVIMDVGAFWGKWTQYVLGLADCRCYLFEPTPINVDRLNKRFGDNPNVRIIAKALTDQVGTRKLNTFSKGLSNSFYGDRKYDELIGNTTPLKVKTVNLDWFFDKFDEPVIDIMKLNVEGSEVDIFRNMRREHAERIRCILWAAHAHQFYYGPAVGEMLEKLVSLGYRVEMTRNGKGKISDIYRCEFDG